MKKLPAGVKKIAAGMYETATRLIRREFRFGQPWQAYDLESGEWRGSYGSLAEALYGGVSQFSRGKARGANR
jgi:hypothetical protein